MAFELNGGKNRQRQSSTFNQTGTTTNTLSPRAAGYLTSGIDDLKGRQFEGVNLDRVNELHNPYTRDVIDASLAQADQADAEAWAGLDDRLARSGAFGDKRRGIMEAELAGQQSRDRASLIAGLNDKGFETSMQTALQETLAKAQYDQETQDLITRLLQSFAAGEGTSVTNASGASAGKSSGFNLGFSLTPFK